MKNGENLTNISLQFYLHYQNSIILKN